MTENLMKNITFYRRFESDIVAGRKTITLRDKSDADYTTGDIVSVARYEDNQFFCHIKVNAVTPVSFHQLNQDHARQENMTLEQLKSTIAEIYPGIVELYMIEFMLCKA
ncbi:ASCH domain-containing protein [Rouxiella silvae]|jgi:uncharacterized protein YqfB (UPF0267 family)|uniref:N(4)-acetylcytidine amidohydrolase n=2 Tax=Rouxiella silvae TaxID=1646373 RepID=A0ABX3U4A3_9GAMM|nr:ASCH domain-containing protein [Rouxiella silvae]